MTAGVLVAAALLTLGVRQRLPVAGAGSAGLPLVVLGLGVLSLVMGVWAAAVAAGAGAAAWRLTRRVVAARRVERVRLAMPEVCRVLASELRAGSAAAGAVAAAAVVSPSPLREHLHRVAAGSRLGLDPADLLLPAPGGAQGLALVAACFRLAADGAPVADVCAGLAGSFTAEVRLRREVRAQLAGARATAWLLAALPVFGLMLSTGLGGGLGAAASTPWGRTCLVVGVLLDLAGLAWLLGIARRAEPR